MKLASIPALALSLVLWSCDNLSEPTGALVGPDVSVAPAGNSGSGYTVVKQNDESLGIVTGIIDENGGKLILDKHELWVPKGAVSGPTSFSMAKVDADNVTVELHATQVTTNDIGAQGFATPVTLKLSYHNTEVEDPSTLQIVWVKPDGTYEVQTTEIDIQGNRAVAQLGHFSQYALAFP